ncbi:FAD-binding oxidoreductase [Alicyclobacillus dauci]|uniref:FAD-binding oxidoreductase n=1 Tax=Alicyclobacillus dauci TaxID=1475485 RepID=A0ABY6YXT9_9BACL|nr:FAD-binding oxidoreductase [Alicyclobacillus dauci]WAH35227.1 FAD-binding oxidoreductase [Alicyclobacillus dauci]
MADQRVQDSSSVIARELSSLVGAQFVNIEPNAYETLDGRPNEVVVVEPNSEDEVARILQLAHASGWTVSPTGAGTQTGFGNVPNSVQLVVKSTRMNGILEYSPSDLVVTTQPGTPLCELQQVLRQHGQMFPIDPVCQPNATVGGILETGVTGPLRTMYGTLRDLTIGLRSVYPNGEVVKAGGKVVKNVAGYDMTKLFIGSLGTLVFVTEVTVKLRPLPVHTELCLLAGSADQVGRVTAQIIDSHLIPSRMEALHGAYEGLGDVGRWALAVESHENPTAAAYQSSALKRLADENGLTYQVLQGNDAEEFWQSYRSTAAATDLCVRYSVPPNRALALSNEALSFLPGTSKNAYFSVTPAAGVARVFASGMSVEDEVIFVTNLRTVVARYGGTVVIENGSVGLRQRVDAFGAAGSGFVIHQRIKEAIDPQHIMNPGRFLGGI